jgi:hypothetical protein
MLSPPFSPANTFCARRMPGASKQDFAARTRRDAQDRDNLSTILPLGHT